MGGSDLNQEDQVGTFTTPLVSWGQITSNISGTFQSGSICPVAGLTAPCIPTPTHTTECHITPLNQQGSHCCDAMSLGDSMTSKHLELINWICIQ